MDLTLCKWVVVIAMVMHLFQIYLYYMYYVHYNDNQMMRPT